MEKDLLELKFALSVNKLVDAYHIDFMEFIEVLNLNERLHKHQSQMNGEKNGKKSFGS